MTSMTDCSSCGAGEVKGSTEMAGDDVSDEIRNEDIDLVFRAEAAVKRDEIITAWVAFVMNAAVLLMRSVVLILQIPDVLEGDLSFCDGHPYASRSEWHPALTPIILELGCITMDSMTAYLRRPFLKGGQDDHPQKKDALFLRSIPWVVLSVACISAAAGASLRAMVWFAGIDAIVLIFLHYVGLI